ncbi:hypothetical protein [Actinoplanes sp. HUAS TT8]|uniref:hypothetical protein n=1 Tax=Actinoplanes sp. HUAS TT8 TaxID=3447453 RepID=UPI003F527F19
MSNGTSGFPPAPANPDLTQPLRTAAAGNPDLTAPLRTPAAGNPDLTAPLRPGAAGNPDMTMPLRTGAAGNPDMTMPLSTAASNGDFDRTMPVGPAGGDLTAPMNLGGRGAGDMTLPVNLATATNIDSTMPVNYVPTQPDRSSAQRNQGGQLYSSTGGYPALEMPVPSNDPVENSGSLTGHILAQGWHDAKVDQRRGNLKVVVAMLIVLGLLVAVSLVFVLTVGSSFSDMLKGVTG